MIITEFCVCILIFCIFNNTRNILRLKETAPNVSQQSSDLFAQLHTNYTFITLPLELNV